MTAVRFTVGTEVLLFAIAASRLILGAHVLSYQRGKGGHFEWDVRQLGHEVEY
jgi:hypothetical protein